MADVKTDLLALSDQVFQRTRRRLDGLSDGEYLWEPVAGCWTIRRVGDEYHADFEHFANPAPFTTIAWRLWHLVGCYGAARNSLWLGSPQSSTGFEQHDPAPAGADLALAALDNAHAFWRGVLKAMPADRWSEPLGAVAGPFGESDRASFVLHQLDEQIHHGAELGVLRDLHNMTVG